MISIDFLKQDRAGMEFIDFQTTRFYNALSACVEKYIAVGASGNVLGQGFSKEVLPIIEEFTGFNNITIKYESQGNLAVDTGYFSPKNVLNNEYADTLLNTTKTTLYRWFAENKVKLFNGTVDYKSGKVTGSFKTIPVNMHINVNLDVIFEPTLVLKTGVPLSGMLAGVIAHELGHVFGGCMMLHTATSDNLVAKAALRHYRAAESTEDRVVVLKDTAAILEVDPAKLAELQTIAKSDSNNSFLLYWNKLTVQRNSRRSLSVGVERMSSEVVADMYAIRMGCSKGVIAAISSMVDRGAITTVVNSLYAATVLTIVAEFLFAPILLALGSFTGCIMFSGVVFSVIFIADYFSKGYSGVYNADHRRFDDAIRQMLARFKEDSRISTAEKAELTKEIDQLLELGKTYKPWYDNTVIYRTVGWIFNGGDFKKQEIEHYTQVLNNHELTLMSSKLAALKARRDPDNIEA